MRVVDLIIKKKNGETLSRDELHFLISGYVNETIPDYQISSLLMAICFQGLSEHEQSDLTLEMLESGERIDLSAVNGICVDKHSTGGVGDKTTLVVAPLVAACGMKMAKMSGRGLGHTGGTLDKLEAIPKFRIALSGEEFFRQVDEISLAVAGQTANIAPADKKLYALRDVTGTVEAVGLIAASIMSKKLASGASHILLDVKVGDGAFMKDLASAQELAEAMVAIGNRQGKKTVALLTDMDQPLGSAVGNSLEVIEAIETLKGRGPKDLETLCLEIATKLLLMTGFEKTREEAFERATTALKDGAALEKLKQMIFYQNGDVRVLEDYSLLPTAKRVIEVKNKSAGYVRKVHALEIGNAAMLLGAGRATKDDLIDLAVGIKVHAKVGDYLEAGDLLATVHANDKHIEEAIQKVEAAFEMVSEKVQPNKLILDIIE
ncbi:MAG TPA: pyrimidine-nucleoside phosphorylase [Acholeplasmataceae bacterium]|nr:pyrimidine-nucleoside phosphorylase [Acholeplasmataceae bacterium]